MNKKENGLTSEQAKQLLSKYGLNEVPEPKFNFFKAFASKLWNLSAWILEGALLLEIILGKGIQASFVLLMLLFAALNGAIQKRRSRKILNDISHQLTPTVSVKRNLKWIKIDSKYLVPGDVISLNRGDVLAADAQLLSDEVTTDESSITGESKPVKKTINDTVFAGTTIVSGHGTALVTETGANSRSGKTVNLINHSAAPGHLQQLLTKIILYLCLLSSVLTVVLIIAALVRHDNVIQMLPFLAMMFIASIPVAMPSTFAVSNSFEAKRLSKEGILTSDLTGIQDAANLNLLLLDKTGTITENKTAVANWTNFSQLSDNEALHLASAAIDQQNLGIIDQALIDYLQEKKIKLLNADSFTPFSSNKGYSEAQIGDTNIKLGSFQQLSKLDPEALDKTKAIDFQAGRSVAVLINNKLAGVFILHDKIRPDSKAALAELKNRGIKTIMLTGDNQRTAAAVAKEVGLTGKVVSIKDFNQDTPVSDLAGIADVLPENKLEMVKLFQKEGYIVGMTGDGVNDAPALKQAEVGIAMANAADVSKRTSKMVLLNDGLMPIVKILDAGHRVYQRMTTWSLTKLSRTAELTMLITLGYLFFGYLPLAFNAMVIYTIMNNMVTLMIGTDHAIASHKPENWNILKLSKISFSLAGGWTLIGFIFMWQLMQHNYSHNTVSTMIYIFLVLSAILLILTTRTKKYFWQSAPSRPVATVQIIDVILTFGLAFFGLAMAKITISNILLTAIIALIAAIIINLVYKPLINKI